MVRASRYMEPPSRLAANTRRRTGVQRMRGIGLRSTVPAFVLCALALALLGCGNGQVSATPTSVAVDMPTAMATGVATAGSVAPAAPPATEAPGPEQGNADVLSVRAVQAADGTWTFHVTVRHPDTGWEDYADGWDVVTPDGQVLKPDLDSKFTRTLLHPHVEEQPFTRSQSGITIPEGVTQVRVRAHDLVAGFGGQEVVVDLEAESGEGFEVERQE